jgi:cytochrome c556
MSERSDVMNREKGISVLAAGIIGIAGAIPGVASAQGSGASLQAAVDFRQSTMTIYKWYLGPMGGMVKGKIPFDAATFASKASGLAKAASLDLTEGFPKGSHEDTDAKPEIWEQWDLFIEKYEILQKEATKLNSVAAGGDMDAIKAQFGATAKTCKGCHQDFKEK